MLEGEERWGDMPIFMLDVVYEMILKEDLYKDLEHWILLKSLRSPPDHPELPQHPSKQGFPHPRRDFPIQAELPDARRAPSSKESSPI